MKTSPSRQRTKPTMFNQQYCTPHDLWCLLTVSILVLQSPIVILAQQTQSASPAATVSSTIPTVLYNDGNVYYGDNDDRDADIYDDQEEANDDAPPTLISQSKLHNNITSQESKPTQTNEPEEENSYPDEDDEFEDQIYGNTMTVNRVESKNPIGDANKKPVVAQSTARMPFISANLWHDLLAKPAILVGIVGGVVIGMLSAILLIMFIIYRMRKKDEGSYALEEGPQKSPSHAYTRVSSREFFA